MRNTFVVKLLHAFFIIELFGENPTDLSHY